MASYSSILRINKPTKSLNRGIQKEHDIQNGVLIEKIYCDRSKGRKSSNIRLVDSSAAENVKCGEQNSVIKSTNSDLSRKPNTNEENVEVGNPQIVQTLETTHTLVTNSKGSYLLHTKKETQSIFNDLSEFPILGANKSIKRDTSTQQSSLLSPYAEPFVFTRSLKGNTIYNAYRNYDYAEDSVEYDPDTADMEAYSNDNIIDGNVWSTTEDSTPTSRGAEYEIVENDDDANYASISLSRMKHLSKLSVDAKPFEFKRNVTQTDNVSGLSSSDGSATFPVQTASRSPSIDAKPFVPKNYRRQNMHPGYCLPEDNIRNEDSAAYDDRSVSSEEQTSGSSSEKASEFLSRNHFDIQSRNFRSNRRGKTEIPEVAKQSNTNGLYRTHHINKSPDSSYSTKDFLTLSTCTRKKTENSNLSADAKPFAIHSPSINGKNAINKSKDKEANDDAFNKKKYPLIPLPSNSIKPSKLRPDAQPFSIPKSKDDTMTEDLKNCNDTKVKHPSSITQNTQSPVIARNGNESSPLRSLQNSHISPRNDATCEQDTKSERNTENSSNKNIVSWRRGALSKLVLNSLDEAPKKDSNNTKKHVNYQLSEKRGFGYSSESENKRKTMLSPGAQPFCPVIKDKDIGNETSDHSKLSKISYNQSYFIPYTPQHWSNEEGPPINASTLSDYFQRIINDCSENQEMSGKSSVYLQNAESELDKGELKKTSALLNTFDSQTKLVAQQNEYTTRQIKTAPASQINSEYRAYSRDPRISNNIYASDSVRAPYPKSTLPAFSNNFNRNTFEKNMNGSDRCENRDQSSGLFANCNNNEKVDDNASHKDVPKKHQTCLASPDETPVNKTNIDQLTQKVMPTVNHQVLNTLPVTQRVLNHPSVNHKVLYPSPVNHGVLFPPSMNHNIRAFKSHVPLSDKFMQSYMNSPSQTQTPENFFETSNPRIHSEQTMTNGMVIPSALPNSYINQSLTPPSGKQYEWPIKLANPLASTYSLGTKLPNEHECENMHMDIVESNSIINKGINNSPPSWSTNYAKDFNDFLDMYAIKLTSQMIPLVQGGQVIGRNLQSPHSIQRELQLENNLINCYNTGRQDEIVLNSQLDRSIVLAEKIKTTANQPNKASERGEILQKNELVAQPNQNPALLIPPPIPPRRKINLTNTTEKTIVQATLSTSLPAITPRKNILSIENKNASNELLQKEEHKNDSSSEYHCQINCNVSNNPFLTDYSPRLGGTSKGSNHDQPTQVQQNISFPNNKQKRGNNPFIDNDSEDEGLSLDSINRPVIDPPKDPLWFYLDPQHDIQGPFTSIEMAEWHHVGYFKDDLKIRRNCDKRFIGIDEFMNLTGSSSPFLDSQSIPPLDAEVPITKKCTNPFSEAYQANASQMFCDLYDS